MIVIKDRLSEYIWQIGRTGWDVERERESVQFSSKAKYKF